VSTTAAEWPGHSFDYAKLSWGAVPSEAMDQADLVLQGIGGRRAEPEEVAERLPPGQSEYVVGAVGQFLYRVGHAPQLIRTARLSVTG
jgi:hypothetical protein